MKYTVPLLAAALILSAPAHAQERTAGQAYDAQTNWSALQGELDLLKTQNQAIAATLDAVSSKLDAIAACGAQKKLWTGTSTCVDVADAAPARTETATFTIPATYKKNQFPATPIYAEPDDAFCKGKGYDGLQSASHYHTVTPLTPVCSGGEGTGGCSPSQRDNYGTTAICYKLVPVSQ